jgi:Cytosine deaminase and related metal-dependent hydrolases
LQRTLITPGLVNVHTHAATAFYRGMAEDRPREFWSAGYAMPGQERFTVEDHVFSVRAACAEFLLNGVTCIADRLATWIASRRPSRVGHPRRRRPFAGRRPGAGRLEDRPCRARTLRHRSPPAGFAGIAPHALDTCSDDF